MCDRKESDKYIYTESSIVYRYGIKSFHVLSILLKMPINAVNNEASIHGMQRHALNDLPAICDQLEWSGFLIGHVDCCDP